MRLKWFTKGTGLGLVLALLLASCGGQTGDKLPNPPAAASGLSTAVRHDGSVILNWMLGAGEHDAVLVYRTGELTPSQTAGMQPLATLAAGTTTYVDATTSEGQAYSYAVGLSWGVRIRS